MPFITHVILRGVSKEQYDAVRDAVGWLDDHPEGGRCHLTWWEGDDCHNTDVWDSQEAFQAFGENQLGPGMAKAGVAAEPEVTFHEAHEVFIPAALTIT